MFVARNRLSTNPFVLDPHRRAHPLPLNSLSLDQLVDLVETVAERYRDTYGDWGHIVGNKLNELVEEAKASDHVNAYYRLGDYLQRLLSCNVDELPSPENIVSTRLVFATPRSFLEANSITSLWYGSAFYNLADHRPTLHGASLVAPFSCYLFFVTTACS